MSKLVISDAEMSIAANRITEYTKYMVNCYSAFEKFLEDVKSFGINSQRIEASLNRLQNDVKPETIKADQASLVVSRYIRQYLEKVENADKFVYDDNNMSSLLGVLSVFL